MSQSLLFSSVNFIVSGLIFRSLVHFEFIFVYAVRECSNFTLLHVAIQLCQHHLWKRLSSLHYIFLSFFYYRLIDHKHIGLFLGSLFCSTYLFLCQHYTDCINVVFWYSSKSRNLIPPVLIFFLKMVLAIQGLSVSIQNLKLSVLVLWEIPWYVHSNCIEYVDCLG